MPSASDRVDFAPPTGKGSVRAFALALLVHALLIAALTWGVNWKRSDTSISYEAELWSAVPQLVAPRLAETPSEPTPEMARPVPVPVPPAPAPPRPAPPALEKPEVKAPPPPPPPTPDVDIALEQEKKRKQLALQKQAEVKKEAAKALEKDKAIALAKKQKERKAEEDQTRRLAQAEAVKQEKEAAREAARQEVREEAREAAKEAKEAQKMQAQKAAQQLAKQQEQSRQAQAASQKQREENLNRLKGMAGANGSANDTGAALKSSGPSASYGGVLRAAIRPNVVFTEEIVGNPMATVEVRVTSDGTVISQRLVKSSGNKSWDDAAVNAIIRTRVMPRDVDGRMPDTILLIDMRARG